MNKIAYIALVFGVSQAIKLERETFMTDEEYGRIQAHKLYEKEHPMADDIDDDHLIQMDT